MNNAAEDEQASISTITNPVDSLISNLKNYYFENETGQVALPQDNVQKPDTPFVTIVKLADQEIYDVVRYLNRQRNNSSTKIVSNTTPRALATESTTTVPPKIQ